MIIDESTEILPTNLGYVKGEKGFIKDGDWIETKDQDPNGEVRLIQLADVGNGDFLNKSNRFLTKDKAQELRCTFLKKGDVLVARMPDPIGRACIFPGDVKECVTAVDVMIIRTDESFVNNRWLKYRINSPEFRNKLTNYITGTTRQRISRSNFERIPLRIPNINHQIKIADLLDKTSSIIQMRKKTIKLADEFLRSTFLEMFGDPKLVTEGIAGSELFKFSSGKFNPVKNLDDSFAYPTYGGNGITGYSSEYLIDFDTIVIGRVGAYCGSIHRTKGKSWITDNAIFIKEFKKEFNLEYLQFLFEYLRLNRFANYSGQPKITQTPLEELLYPYAKIEMQNKFGKIVVRTEQLKEKYQSSLTEMENQFNSLMQKAFRGEL